MAAAAQGATPRADIARPTDFNQVEPGTSVLQCKSGSLMTCGRQATGRMALPKGSGPKGAYRFVEEDFLFDTGVGIFLQTATARDKGQHMEWRRRLAFRKGANGGFQLLQVGLQYRCAGGEWSKVACRPAAQKPPARKQAGAAASGPQTAAASKDAGGSKGVASPVREAPDAVLSKGVPGAAASDRAEVKGADAGRPTGGTAPAPTTTPASPAADATAGKAAAGGEVRKAEVPAPGGQGAPAAGNTQDAGQRVIPPLDAQWRPLGQPAAGQPDSASSSGQDAATVSGAGAAAAGAAGAQARGSMDDAISRAEQADAARNPPAALPKSAPVAANGAQTGTAQPGPLKPGEVPADGSPATMPPTTIPGVGETAAATGEILPGTRSATGPGGLIRLIPTLPASVRTAQGFSPLVLSTEDAVRLSKPCDQPIELCGQRVFDEAFSPESYAELLPEQIQRESFIYADSPITSAVYLVTMVNLPDDSLAAERIRIEFVRRGSAWVAVSAARQMRCRRGESAVPSDWTDRACP